MLNKDKGEDMDMAWRLLLLHMWNYIMMMSKVFVVGTEEEEQERMLGPAQVIIHIE